VNCYVSLSRSLSLPLSVCVGVWVHVSATLYVFVTLPDRDTHIHTHLKPQYLDLILVWVITDVHFLLPGNAGKEAAVSMEYNRKVGGPEAVAAAAANGSAAPSVESRIMSFGSVQITEKDPGGAPRQSNVCLFSCPSHDFQFSLMSSQR
jgi:hypothetical protein